MSRRERQRRRHQHHTGARPLLLGFGIVLAVAIVAVLGVVGYVIAVAASAPSLSSLKPIDQGATSVVYAADGQRLGFIQSPILRTPVPSSAIPQTMKDATVAIEDRRFYQHKGVDFEGIVRAAVKNLQSHGTVQGGSTLTMQLIKNLYPRVAGKRDYKVKIREAKLAEELENVHPGRAGKDWVLAKYLNNVPYGTAGGQEAIGVQAAARIFFNKPASQLTLAEAATLAGLPQAPSDYNPFYEKAAARKRRNEVLTQMAKQGYVTPSKYYTERREGYFFDYVISELTKRYGADTVRRGGLHIYTTLDLKLQRAARQAMAKGIAGTNRDSAIVSIDPDSGYIRAMATSRKYGDLNFNLAAQGHRQPGSTFKVMVLMTALRRGVDPNATTYTSEPLDFDDPRWGPIKVKTYSNSYLVGRTNLVKATLTSDNSIYEQLDLDLGPPEVRKTAYDMGITTHLNGYPAEGLGGLHIGVSPLEMARAYATIANGGSRIRPIAVMKVRFPDGHVETPLKPEKTRVFSDGVAYEATKILHQNILGGTGTAANIGCPAAGKTGTTDEFSDAWFVGYTPRLSTAVWVGHANSREPMPGAAGGTAAAPIWGAYMKVAKGAFCGDFPQPTEPFAPVPFFGEYSKTGVKGNRAAPVAPVGTTQAQGLGTGKGKGKKKKGKGGKAYDPGLYESPPQQAPPTQPPPPAPTPPPGSTPTPTPNPGGTGGAAPTGR
jgi:penicillin-binding protein 1A